MKPIVLLLLLSLCVCRINAQQVEPDVAAPGRQASDNRTATPGPASCPQCNPDEQLVVDLMYYKQILDILEEIDQQRRLIDSGLLRSVHAELRRLRPDLAALLKTPRAAPTRPATPPKKPEQPAKKPAQPVKKPAKTVNKPAPKRGMDGLVVGHVNDENRELGIKASVVLVSNGRPRSLNVGGVVEHNRRRFKVIRVDYVEDRDKGNRHEVHLEDQTSKQIHVVPWQ